MCMATPSSCPYSPKCLEDEFSEVRTHSCTRHVIAVTLPTRGPAAVREGLANPSRKPPSKV